MSAKRVLLSEGSSLSARQAITALGKAGYTIDICDPNPVCLGWCSNFVRRWYRCPALGLDPIGYLRFITDRVAGGDYDVLFPAHEQAFLFSRVRERLSRHVGLAVTEFEAFCRVQNKASCIQLVDELGMSQPRTEIVRSAAELAAPRAFPFYIKVEYGTASASVWRVDGPAERSAVVARLHAVGLLDGTHQLLVQEPAPGFVERAQAIFDMGRLVAWHGYKQGAVGLGGGDLFKVSVLRPAVRDEIARLGVHLSWHGALSVDYLFEEGTQAFSFIDFNARLVEPMNAWFAGVNLPDLWARIALGEHIDPVPSGPDGVRTHMTLMALLDASRHRYPRVEVVRRLARALLGRGEFANSDEELTPVGMDRLSILPLVTVAARLLLRPGAAVTMTSETVRSYSLSPEAARVIMDWDPDALPEAHLVSG
ncbi:MAG: hypothetical protein P4L84_03045 [Isosphaeraceae bacterium]|nr:hypothetical protein [Isosphaeraceae bacterium]